MSRKLTFASRTFPSRIADLGFTVDLPTDWISHPLPDEEADFSNPMQFAALAVVTAPHAAIVFAFAARPAYGEGTLHDWAWYLLREGGFSPRAVGAGLLGPLPAVVGEATQDSDVGPMVVRFAFAEDGGRLLNVTLSAPELLADAVRDAWPAALSSFRLETPRGPTVALDATMAAQAGTAGGTAAATAAATAGATHGGTAAGTAAGAAGAAVAGAEDPAGAALAAAAGPSVAAAAATPHDASAGDVPGPAADSAASPPPTAAVPAESFAAHALAADASSLDPEHPMNVNLRDRGAGLVPNVVSTDDGARRATVAAGAIVALFAVPYGWHVVDDGRRTLVLEPTGKVQIHLHLLSREGRDVEAVLDAIEAEARESYPAPEFVRLSEGRIRALAMRNIRDGDQPLEQVHMLVDGPTPQLLLRARVTTTPERAVQSCNLAQLLLESLAFPPASDS